MRGAATIAWRDFRSAFDAPSTHVLLAVFLIISGLRFLDLIATFSGMSDAVRQRAVEDASMLALLSVDQAVVTPYVRDLGLMLFMLVPLLTMRLLAEEKRSGTMELLLTSPVSPAALVAGKFAAGLMLTTVPLLLSSWHPLTLWILADPDMGALAWGLFGVVALAAAFTSVGLLASSVTESPLLSAFLAFAMLLALTLAGAAGDVMGGPAGAALSFVSPMMRFGSMLRGVLDTGDLAFMACFTFAFLFLTHRVVESRRWR